MSIRFSLALAILLVGRNPTVWATSATNSPSAGMPGHTLTLATGNERGVYYAFGHAISNAAAKDGLTIQVLASKGSVENLEWLIAGQVDLCLAQSDVAYDCFRGVGQFNKPATNLIALAPIYTEVVHILVRSRLKVKRIQDFAGKRVALGPQGSGTEGVARHLLDAAGISISEIQPLYIDLAASLDSLRQDEVDIVFFMSGYPSEAIESTLKSGDAWLFEPNMDVCERLVSDNSCFVVSTIPRLTYSGQYEDDLTIGIRALILGRSDSGEHISYAIAKAVEACHREGSEQFRIPKADAHWDMATVVPLAPGAIRYFEETGLVRQLAVKQRVGYVFGILIVVGAILVLARFRHARRRVNSDGAAIGLAACFLLLVWAIGSFVLYHAERKINDSYGTLFLSFWSSLINWLNFGTKEPYTLLGRITATVMMGLGAGGVLWFAKNVWKGITRMHTKHSDHYVIINWNPKGHRLLQQLRSSDFRERRDIVVILGTSPVDGSELLDGDGVTYIKEDGLTEDALTRAWIKDAYSVIILADESGDAAAADAKTILAILAVRQLPGKDDRQVPIIAEIRSPQKMKLAKYVGVLENGSVEVVSSDHLGADLLCQAAVNPGVTHVYEDLLSFGKDSQEIYAQKIPPGLAGRSFTDIRRHALDGSGKKTSVIPLGIKRGDVTHLNPPETEISSLQADDVLFAVCDNAEALKQLLENAARAG